MSLSNPFRHRHRLPLLMVGTVVSAALLAPPFAAFGGGAAPVAPPAAPPPQTVPPPAAPKPAALPPGTFANPLVTSGATADPWVVRHNGFYYFTFTAGGHIEIWKSPTLTGLDKATKTVVWRAPATGPNSRDVWAPELHFWQNKPVLVYTATDENRTDANRRLWVLEGDADPLGSYRDRGKIIFPGADVYAIDGTLFEQAGRLYLAWSGRKGGAGDSGAQNIFLAPMTNPWTPAGERVLLSSPTFPWEKAGWQVNEGPQLLTRAGRTFIAYSASGGTTPDYCLGLLSYDPARGGLLEPAAWRKSPVPVFSQYQGPDGAVYTPGHNSFTTSPDGREDWIVYHAKDRVDHSWRDRTVRAQRVLWNADNSPNFGHPVPPGVPLAAPSGEPGARAALAGAAPAGTGTGLLAKYFAAPDFSGPVRTRLDSAVNFDWGLDAPAKTFAPADGFSVRWRGQIQPRFGGAYTFQTYADDGVRLWVNGQKLIDAWADRPASADRGTITLAAGRKYDIRLDYYERRDRARISLAWSSARQPWEIVPRSQLYPPAALQTSSRR